MITTVPWLASPSSRREWIEIKANTDKMVILCLACGVSLLAEGVD
jgi:hypothetical protein